MSNKPIPVTVPIMDSEYRVACPEDEREALLAAAGYLNDQMLAIRESGKIMGIERIAVMAALNITHELLNGKAENASLSDYTNGRVLALLQKVETVLSKSTSLIKVD